MIPNDFVSIPADLNISNSQHQALRGNDACPGSFAAWVM